MPRLYREFNHDLAWSACCKALDNKWRRNDVRTFIEEWTGHSRYELNENELENGSLRFKLKYEILEEIAFSMEDMVDGILHGVDPDFDPVTAESRPDGNTGKIRLIATLCLRHQILGHIVFKGLEPLMQARILPTQHASIPKRGQTNLARQIKRYLNRKLGITKFVKTDCAGAYASVLYSVCIRLIEQEVSRAKWIIACMRVLERYAPGGHLIIGGYLDAWLFNFVMSYALRYIYSLHQSRRGKNIPMVIRAATFMDDMALLGKSRKALLKAVEQAREWMQETLGLKMRTTTDVISLFSIERERERRHQKGARKGCPAIDMGGYLIHRSYITVRKRNIPKIARAADRAWREIKETGTIKRQRACQIIARNGMIRNSDSFRFIEEHHLVKLMRMARKIQSYWSLQDTNRRKERLFNAAAKHQIQCKALCYPY